jgi:hypothetical protein
VSICVLFTSKEVQVTAAATAAGPCLVCGDPQLQAVCAHVFSVACYVAACCGVRSDCGMHCCHTCCSVSEAPAAVLWE